MMEIIPHADIDQVRARNAARHARKAAATPGPWEATYTDRVGCITFPNGDWIWSSIITDRPADIAFISAARDDPVEADIDALIADRELLLGLLARLGEAGRASSDTDQMIRDYRGEYQERVEPLATEARAVVAAYREGDQ